MRIYQVSLLYSLMGILDMLEGEMTTKNKWEL